MNENGYSLPTNINDAAIGIAYRHYTEESKEPAGWFDSIYGIFGSSTTSAAPATPQAALDSGNPFF